MAGTDLEEEVLAQEWFYRFNLPSGRQTSLYISDEVERIHTTRAEMMWSALDPILEGAGRPLTGIDVASHQGYYSLELAKRCSSVLGLEYQQRHVESSELISRACNVDNVRFVQENVETMASGLYEPADIVICFGLMYNLENPIGVMRRLREMTKKVLLIETQTTILDLEGLVDSGHADNTNYMHGYFGLFAGNPENIDGSASDIVFYPSKAGLMWVLTKLGFEEVEMVAAPANAYQQLATGKRVMVKAVLPD